MRLLAILDRWLAFVLRAFIVGALTAMLVLIALGVFVRVVPIFSMSGYDEIIEWLVAWLTFSGAVALWREGILFRVDLVSFMRPGPASKALAALAQALGLLFAVVFTLKSYEFAIDTIETTPFLAVSKVPWYAAMPVCGALMVVYAVAGLVRTLSGPIGAPAPSTIPQTRSE